MPPTRGNVHARWWISEPGLSALSQALHMQHWFTPTPGRQQPCNGFLAAFRKRRLKTCFFAYYQLLSQKGALAPNWLRPGVHVTRAACAKTGSCPLIFFWSLPQRPRILLQPVDSLPSLWQQQHRFRKTLKFHWEPGLPRIYSSAKPHRSSDYSAAWVCGSQRGIGFYRKDGVW